MTKMTERQAETAIQRGLARRVRGGYAAVEGLDRLRELTATLSPANLETALVYDGFATEAGAPKLAAAAQIVFAD